jgi:hypothetical protein
MIKVLEDNVHNAEIDRKDNRIEIVLGSKEAMVVIKNHKKQTFNKDMSNRKDINSRNSSRDLGSEEDLVILVSNNPDNNAVVMVAAVVKEEAKPLQASRAQPVSKI